MLVMAPVPGWYANPENAAELRWWDGSAWTTRTAPAYGVASSGWSAPPAPRRRIWPWIVIPFVGVAILLGACAAIFVPRVIGQFKHPIDAANVYYGDIRDGRLPDAYAHLCLSYRAGYDQFVANVRSNEQEAGHITKFNAHQVHRVVGHGDEALVDVDLTTTQRRYPIQVRMLKEGGHWHWCGRREVTN